MKHYCVKAFQHDPASAYVPQFEPRETVEAIITAGHPEHKDSPRWHTCGMCCVKMIAKAAKITPIDAMPIEALYQAAVGYGVYSQDADGTIFGAIHRELAEFITEELCLRTSPMRDITVYETIAKMILRDRCFIASVSPKIRENVVEPLPVRTGHLVLVYGFDIVDNDVVFHIHNSAGFASTNTQVDVRIAAKRFMRCFSGCGIAVDLHQS